MVVSSPASAIIRLSVIKEVTDSHLSLRIFTIATCSLGIQDLNMPHLEVFTISEQVAGHLRKEILEGRLQGLMPGRNELAADCVESVNKLMDGVWASAESVGVASLRGTHYVSSLFDGSIPDVSAFRSFHEGLGTMRNMLKRL